MKILTGVYTKDGGTVTIDGQERTFKMRKKQKPMVLHLYIKN